MFFFVLFAKNSTDMNKTKTKKSFSYRDLLYKVLIFIGTVAIIVYFLPRDGKFNYQFDIDKPWKYGQLMATFDFPIYKDDAVVKREQDSILAAFQPYYQLDKSIEKTAISKLKADYQSHLRDIVPSSDYMRYLEKRLSEIYKAGILSTDARPARLGERLSGRQRALHVRLQRQPHLPHGRQPPRGRVLERPAAAR